MSFFILVAFAAIASFANSYDHALHNLSSLTAASVHQAGVLDVNFRDVFSSSGLSRAPSRKWGGPHVSDLNGDGIYDVILTTHNRGPIDVFFGNAGGSFSRGNYIKYGDIHGISSSPRTVEDPGKIFTVSYGGGRGTSLSVPGTIRVGRDRTITDVTSQYGLGKVGGRGRNVIFMDMSLESPAVRRANLGGPDMLYMNFLGNIDLGLRQFAYKNVRGSFVLRSIPGIAAEPRARAEVTDINGDGYMEVVTIRLGRMFRLTAPFTFAEVSNQVWNPSERIVPYSGAAAAELDYDNDGDFDLYVATCDVSILTFLPSSGRQNDRLYANRGGKYVDVSRQAGIPAGTNSKGVTVGDFNNDGFVDILVALHAEPDMLLLNKGDGTFQRSFGKIPKNGGTLGNNAVAVDYDLDGRLDAFVGHGDQEGPDGPFKLMKNLIPLTGSNKYLLVRVGNSPGRAAIALHAKLTIRDGSTTLTRRVGSSGAQNGGQNYIDTVHFGVGSRSNVNVFIRWSDGATQQRSNVPTNTKISVGIFP